MNSKQFESECNDKIGGYLFDESWNSDYQEAISLTVKEMRQIVNILRSHEGLPAKEISEWTATE